MRRVRLLVVATAICLLGPTVPWVSAEAATGSITVTPNTDLMAADLVHVDGAGFPGSELIGFCQAVITGAPSPSDCDGGIGNPVSSTPTGTFSIDVGVSRTINVPSIGRSVDCAVEACYVAAAVVSDIANTVVYARISFSADLADGRIKRRSDGVIFGDNVYFGQGRTHTIAPGGYWTYALQVQNDGPTTADLNTTGSFSSTGLAAQVQFFYGYYDVTSLVLSSSGLTFPDMAPGEVRLFALQFHVPADAEEGTDVSAGVAFASGNAGITDAFSMHVVVHTPT